MAERLLETFPQAIASLELLPSSGGRFEVIADGELIYSKKETGRHAEFDEVAAALRATLT